MSINWKDFILRSLASIIGITFISFGAALSESMDMGLDPFTALNKGASSLLGFSLGNYQLGLNLIILAIVFFLKRSLIGWGTIYNMILIGYQVSFFGDLFKNFFNIGEINLAIRLIIAVVAIMIFTLGVALYMDTKLGVSPYDAITPVITDRTGWNYTPVRVGQDLFIVLGAYLLAGPVGISTIITGFFAGPLISFFSKKISQPLIEKLGKLS
ncbi:Uncharacterized membrane protein YczE [Carnobacterium iners]|uniref:Uncharacterized membrane protein YczE n=1 Tax=Carnobacterium iners TaxID=1073423 RepID=A0A1X7MTL1_9LACT|nr:hypothetical protein [Carnobacterium iners]SEK58007.1 Uncharacterized membrane protein YczE [Carnobacterium iners]SMH28065.1 Uncharacterized membrane protein YczE [Carnobacterium iners]